MKKHARSQCRQNLCYEPTLQTPAMSVLDTGMHTYTSAGTHIPGFHQDCHHCPVVVQCPGRVFLGDNPRAVGGLQVFAQTREL